MLEVLATDFNHIFTSAGLLSLLNLILIDIVMSGDNAILIGMATCRLTGKERKKAIFWGIAWATLLRIIFSLGAVFLLQIEWLEFLGAVLLLYVVWKFYREIRVHEWHDELAKSESSLTGAIRMIIIADIAMSLDNVLAVAGASHGNVVNLAIGLIISIILMVVASGYIARMLERYPSIQWTGLFIILFTALEMLERWFSDVAPNTIAWIPETTIFTWILILVVWGFSVLQTKYLMVDYSWFGEWAKRNGKILMICIFLFLILLATLGDKIYVLLNSHHGYKYGVIMIAVLGMLEILRIRDPESSSDIMNWIKTKSWKSKSTSTHL